eukprot:COSAG04_NODE_2641_length_3819_cov_2.065323_2_plen_93_part_00
MQEAEQKTMLEHEKLKISELAEQVEQERVAAENAKATAEAEITDELKKARKILGCASRIASKSLSRVLTLGAAQVQADGQSEDEKDLVAGEE